MNRLFKLIFVIVIIFALFSLFRVAPGTCPLARPKPNNIKTTTSTDDLSRARELLRIRNDHQALAIFDKVLKKQPLNLDALWGKAEVLRRSRDFKESEELLSIILKENPQYIPAILSYAYIKYKDNQINPALKLIHHALKIRGISKGDEAIALMLLGTINSRLSQKGWLFSKIRYGTHIKNYFLKAERLAPDLPEVHLGLGTFYLKAPHIAGGNLNSAFKELNLALGIAPNFATVNARLAQAYRKNGNSVNFKLYIEKAKKLDPENEVVKEIENEK